MNAKALLLLVAIGLLSGCVGIQIGVYPGAKFPPTDPATVQIYRDFPPDRDAYQIIGEFTVEEALGDYDSLFYQRLKRRVAEVGGDAVVLSRRLEGMIGFTTPGRTTTNTTASAHAVATPAGNSAVVTGSMSSQTSTMHTPPQTLQLGSYSGQGYVLRFKQR